MCLYLRLFFYFDRPARIHTEKKVHEIKISRNREVYAGHATNQAVHNDITTPRSFNCTRLKLIYRTKLRRAVELFTRYCRLNYHLHNTGIFDDPTCRACVADDETSLQVIFPYGHLQSHRYRILGAKPPDVNPSILARKLLAFCAASALTD